MSEEKNNRSNSHIVAKAGIWYTICNFLFRGMAFITTPIFTRLLTKNEIGSFSNMASWIGVLTVLTAFDLQTSIIRSKLEHEKDIDSYILSILSLTTLTTLFFYCIVMLFPVYFMKLLQMDMKYIHAVFVYLLVSPAYFMLITKQRAFYKYKMFVLLTGISVVFSTLLSLGLVLLMDNKLAGRFFGYYAPQITMGIIIYLYLVFKGRKIKLQYWKYACAICLPLVPHALSLYLLSSSDKIIITKLCGAEYTAIYSIAYSCYHIVTILFDSMNKAWAPWLLDSLHSKNYGEIKRVSKIYIQVFQVLSIGILMFVPEIVLILGGKQYLGAIYCLPPLITSCVFQFIYTMYVNIEFYKKKTIGVAGATVFATILNITLNLLFIPLSRKNSYVIAAYTTLAGYIVLFVLHYLLVKRLKMEHIYDIKYIVIVLISTLIFSLIINVLYSTIVLRYIVIVVYAIAIFLIVFKKRDIFFQIILKK